MKNKDNKSNALSETVNTTNIEILNKDTMGTIQGGGKINYIPVDGSQFHTDTDCLQEYKVQHSFLGIKWTEKGTITRGCTHHPSTGNTCETCCQECEYRPNYTK